jgi:outer membrane protein
MPNLELKNQEITAIRSRFLPTLSATYNLQWSSAEPGAPNFFENKVRFQTLGISFSLLCLKG